MEHSTTNDMAVQANVDRAGGVTNNLKLKSIYHFECFDSDGNLKWEETVPNLVTTGGLNDILDKYFKGSSYTAAWYVGLKGTGSAAAGDTLASHGGWSELESYSGTNRATLTLGSVSGGSVDNSASKASFAITGSMTVHGAFVTPVQANTTDTGLIYGVADFSGGSRAVVNGDTLNVTVTLTAASA